MKQNSIWIVAVSGGPDSMALLDVLYHNNHQLVVAHVNYLTRETSSRDEEIVRDYCEKFDIILRTTNFDVSEVKNFQHDAREFRYNFFKELVREYGAKGVAMGHHFDDDLETYVFQKERKMYSDYIGMANKTKIKGICVWRPLLKYSKKELVEYCHQNNVEYGLDETNLELDYSRNKIRHEISLLEKDQYRDLVLEMNTKRKEWADFKDKMLDSVNSWETLVPLKSYAKIIEANRFLYLRAWLRKNKVDVHDVSEEYLKEIDLNIIKETANYQFDDMVLISSYDNVSLFKSQEYEYILNDRDYCQTKYFSMEKEGLKRQGITVEKHDFPLKIRNARHGDKIKMRYGTKNVHRYFIDEKIPHHKRDSWPVIENVNQEIIFVVGMGCSVNYYSNNPTFYMVE